MKYIKGYERLYSITEDGRIYSHYSKRFLKPAVMTTGYYQIRLCKNGEKKFYLVHRLVAENFIPNPDNLPIVNHKDEDRTNNHVDNLEWCSISYNYHYGTCAERAAAGISEKKSKPVYCVELDRIFKSQTEASRELGINQGNISNCCNGRVQTAGGYHWKRIEKEAA